VPAAGGPPGGARCPGTGRDCALAAGLRAGAAGIAGRAAGAEYLYAIREEREEMV
jgi:hypothetical protein